MFEQHHRALRQKYKIAHEAYQHHASAVSAASTGGALPSKTLLDNEADSVRALGAARCELMAAMAALHEQLLTAGSLS